MDNLRDPISISMFNIWCFDAVWYPIKSFCKVSTQIFKCSRNFSILSRLMILCPVRVSYSVSKRIAKWSAYFAGINLVYNIFIRIRILIHFMSECSDCYDPVFFCDVKAGNPLPPPPHMKKTNLMFRAHLKKGGKKTSGRGLFVGLESLITDTRINLLPSNTSRWGVSLRCLLRKLHKKRVHRPLI